MDGVTTEHYANPIVPVRSYEGSTERHRSTEPWELEYLARASRQVCPDPQPFVHHAEGLVDLLAASV